MKTLTIDELYSILRCERIKGNGSKKILISDDDEGNGYHECFFGVTPVSEDLIAYAFLHGVSKEDAMKDYVALG
jgi:hypothetical protein